MKAEIEAYLAHLQASERYDEAESFSYWLDDHGLKLSVTCCTSGARLVARRFDGKVRGYSCREGDKRVGADVFGHDFALVGLYLVDYWARYVDECSAHAVLHLIDDGALVRKLYGNPRAWETVPV